MISRLRSTGLQIMEFFPAIHLALRPTTHRSYRLVPRTTLYHPWTFKRLEEAQAAVSHDHPDAIAASKAVARSTVLLSRGELTGSLRSRLERDFDYELSSKAVRARPKFDVTAKGTAQTAITIALGSESFEDTIRDAALLGGDTDTFACIAGAIAESIHGVPRDLANAARQRLTPDLLTIVEHFDAAMSSRSNEPRS